MRPTACDFRPEPATEKKVFAWLAVAFVTVGLMVSAAVQNNQRQAESAEWAAQRREYVAETDAILLSVTAGEAAQRAFLLKGQPALKKAAAEHFARANSRLKTATRMALENPEQLDRLGRVAELLQARIDGAAGESKELERVIGANQIAETRLLIERDEALLRHARRTDFVLYGGCVIVFVLFGLAFENVRADLKWRRAATAGLENKLHDYSAELRAADDKLRIEGMEQQWGHAALQRLVNHHEEVLNAVREGVFVVSKNGHIISANPAAADLVRKEARQLAGKSIGAVLLNNDRLPFPWEKHFLRSPLKNGRAVLLQPAALKQADGTLLDVQMACHPTRDRENLTGAVITVTHSPIQYKA